MRTLSLKVDVCTHDGLVRGVPRLLDLFARHRVRASFFVSFGPDNAGRAVLQALRPGFLRKMVRSGAPSLYGWRTMVSGTLLPARPIGSGRPDLVRRIAAEGHEVAVHAWDHRRWQDRLPRMPSEEIAGEFARAFASYEEALRTRPRAVGAAAWLVTAESLRVADALGIDYASDLRGGPPCRLRAGGETFRTPQFPTTGPCIEELLARGVRDEPALAAALLDESASGDVPVLAVHAEVEGGPYLGLLDRLLPRLRERCDEIAPLADVARRRSAESLPVRDLVHVEIPGRSGVVATSAAGA